METLQDIDLKLDYNTSANSTVEEYTIPCLSASNKYFRGVGYFSASSLLKLSRGLSIFLNKEDAKIRLLLSIGLEDKEIDIIKRGYELKQNVDDYPEISKKIESDLELAIKEMDEIGRMPIDLLAKLIALNILEIKIAICEKGIFHDKLSLFEDAEGNKVASRGSDNQTNQGQSSEGNQKNFESFSVYRSWKHEHFKGVEDLINKLWKNENLNSMVVMPFSRALEKKYFTNRIRDRDFTDNSKMNPIAEEEFFNGIYSQKANTTPCVPELFNGKDFKIKKHQLDALINWGKDNYIGILEHATGSGKTITSIYGATQIYEKKKKLALIISVPYRELRDQWSEEVKKFSWNPIVCSGDWQNRLSDEVVSFKEGLINNLCIIVANKTMSENTFFKEQIDSLNNDSLMFIGDECHHHTTELRRRAIPNARYLLGLSATPFHYFDEGKVKITKEIYKKISDTFSLKQALDQGILTPMRYNTEQVFLTEDELSLYENYTQQIASIIDSNKENKSNKTDPTPIIAKRSRLLTSSSEKLPSLVRLLNKNNSPGYHSLFYVGDGRIDNDSVEDDEESQKQIERTSQILDDLGLKTSRFTYKESSKERRSILSSFKDEDIHGIVAIKCLDEGIDIPVCKTAYLIASGKDKRQYIQRAGRILRKADEKKEANVYDFLMFPIPDEEELSDTKKNLIRDEIKRADHFITHSLNEDEQKKRISSWLSNYDLDYDELIQEIDEI